MRVGKVRKFKKSKRIGWKMEKLEEMEKVERRTEGGHTVSEGGCEGAAPAASRLQGRSLQGRSRAGAFPPPCPWAGVFICPGLRGSSRVAPG